MVTIVAKKYASKDGRKERFQPLSVEDISESATRLNKACGILLASCQEMDVLIADDLHSPALHSILAVLLNGRIAVSAVSLPIVRARQIDVITEACH